MSSVRLDAGGRLIIGGVGSLEHAGKGFHTAWARRKLRSLYPDLGDLPFEHGWSGRIAMTGDHIPKVVSFGPGAYAVFGYSGRGIAPGTVFGRAAAIALIEDDPAALPKKAEHKAAPNPPRQGRIPAADEFCNTFER